MPPEPVVWTMVILVSLVVGFLIGWLLEYYLDLKYWEIRAKRRGFTVSERTTAPMTAPTGAERGETEAKADKQLAVTLREFLTKREAEVGSLRQELERQKTRFEDLSQQFEQYVTTHPDDLTAIRGIGRIYQWKLRDAGIASYTHLAETSPERLREILEVPTWRKFDPQSWIDQAKVLAKRESS